MPSRTGNRMQMIQACLPIQLRIWWIDDCLCYQCRMRILLMQWWVWYIHILSVLTIITYEIVIARGSKDGYTFDGLSQIQWWRYLLLSFHDERQVSITRIEQFYVVMIDKQIMNDRPPPFRLSIYLRCGWSVLISTIIMPLDEVINIMEADNSTAYASLGT